MADYQGHIENFIGTVKAPVGLAGPLCLHGAFARGTYYVPLATTEAALVASYSWGAQLLTAAGGCTARYWTSGWAVRRPSPAGQSIRAARFRASLPAPRATAGWSICTLWLWATWSICTSISPPLTLPG